MIIVTEQIAIRISGPIGMVIFFIIITSINISILKDEFLKKKMLI